MCGIVGILNTISLPRMELQRIGETMADQVAHRGPDGKGVWVDEQAGVCLAHRRLSIIDLSGTGAQPMISHCGRFVLSFNGEIYNFRALRKELEVSGRAPPWLGTSDTEVLLAYLIANGTEKCLPQLDGMFAFALWDKKTRALTLARDRFGEKPIYYGLQEGRLAFGSELRALLPVLSLGDNQIDSESVDWLLRYLYVPAPRSIFRGVFKLPPACSITINADHVRAARLPEFVSYWSALKSARNSLERPFAGSFEDAVEETERLLASSVTSRLVSDVPVGIMLSGGIDSSCIAALAQRSASRPLRTFTIGIKGSGFDESFVAEETARHLGSEHTTVKVGAAEALGAVTAFTHRLDEPFADSSQLVTRIVSQALRTHVTVALAGDGGDELFGGYVRYKTASRLWQTLKSFPMSARTATAALINFLGPDRVAAILQGGRASSSGDSGRRFQKAVRALASASPAALFEILLTSTNDDEKFCRREAALPTPVLPELVGTNAACFARQMMAHDTENFLPNDILTKVDRSSMAFGLETRAPFLQPDLHAFAWSLPSTYLFQNGRSKAVLRAIAARYTPPTVSYRPKQGFSIPLASWLRGPLRNWADDVIYSSQMTQNELIDCSRVRNAWRRHLEGEDMASSIWPVLVFESWRRTLRESW